VVQIFSGKLLESEVGDLAVLQGYISLLAEGGFFMQKILLVHPN